MCIVSNVHDAFQPIIPQPNSWPLTPTAPPALTPEELQKIIDSYKVMLEEAEKVDALTNQPDCEDPDKAKLLDRVAKIQEALDALRDDLEA